jgi:tRNA-specific 2-thiouridylase
MTRGKAIALLSGGLDSRLAVKLMLEQGIEVEAINFVTPFCTCTAQGCRSEARAAAAEFGIPLRVVNNSEALLDAVKKPRFGFGRGLNPCLDCRILAFRGAAERMEETGASFVVTGEVLGQRPMSQRRQAMEIIERESGLEGRVLRPLSAKHFPPTEPERQGLVDREKLLAIAGRSRREQMDLAEEKGINDYPCPAGGCLLTDPGFAARLRSLLDENPDPSMSQVTLLKVGRHFVSSDGQRILVPRDDLENRRLWNLRRHVNVVLEAEGVGGPQGAVMTQGDVTETTLREAAALVARYGQARGGDTLDVTVTSSDGSWTRVLTVSPALGAQLAGRLTRL